MATPDEMQDRLAPLLGTWKGRGAGSFPTIDAFEYEETLSFTLDEDYPHIHYEQRTRLSNGDAGHWEMGFLRWPEDDQLELSNAQDSGRVEVLRGRLLVLPMEGLELIFDSVVLGHDPRLLSARRVFELRGNQLRYVMHMATNTTDEARTLQHLEAQLERVDGEA
jgi:hypothetical protein